MHNPKVALQNWLRILKPGGHLIVLVPDEDMYEQGVFPSTFNPDHKWTFTVSKSKSWSARSLNLMTLLTGLDPSVDIIKLEQITGSFRFGMPRGDQTLSSVGEAAIEFIIRKRPPEEMEIGGCLPTTRKSRVDKSNLKFGEQWIFDNLHRIRDVRIATGTAVSSAPVIGRKSLDKFGYSRNCGYRHPKKGAAQSRASALMRRLRSRLERQQGDEKKLRVLLHKLTKSG